MSNIWKTSIENLVKLVKKSEFLPSMAENAPTNKWQFEKENGPDVEICEQPDPVSDEETFYAPCTVQKPRDPDIYRQFLSMFSKPISKKDEMTVDSAYDPELEEAEAKAMGEETLLEYSKGFYDPKKHDFPKNTTWLNTTYQDQEPSKPLPVTYSPESNDAFLDQNGPDGTPRRFMGKPKGEFSSTSGEVIPALKNMWKYRNAAIDNMTRDITAGGFNSYWVNPEGEIFEAEGTHDDWIKDNQALLERNYGFNTDDPNLFSLMIEKGWVRIGEGYRNTGYVIQLQDPKHIPLSVLDWIYSHAKNGDVIEFSWGGENAYLDIEWPVRNLQQEVNKALQRKRMGNLNITAITRQYALYVGGRLAIRTLTRQKALKICQGKISRGFC